MGHVIEDDLEIEFTREAHGILEVIAVSGPDHHRFLPVQIRQQSF